MDRAESLPSHSPEDRPFWNTMARSAATYYPEAPPAWAYLKQRRGGHAELYQWEGS